MCLKDRIHVIKDYTGVSLYIDIPCNRSTEGQAEAHKQLFKEGQKVFF